MTIDDAGARRLILAAAAVGSRPPAALRAPLLDRQAADPRRARVPGAGARASPTGRGFVYDDDHRTGDGAAVRARPGLPGVPGPARAGRPVPSSTPARVKVGAGAARRRHGVDDRLDRPGAAGTAGRRRRGRAGRRLSAARLDPGLRVQRNAVQLRRVRDHVRPAARRRSGVADAGARHAGRRRLALAAGLLAGVAALVRPAMLLFLPLAALWLCSPAAPVARRWRCVRRAVVVAPWTLRNVRVYDRLVLVASEGGVTFWTGNHPLAGGEGDLAANPAIKQAELAFRQRHAGLSAGADGAALLPRRAGVDRRASRAVAAARAAESVLYVRPDRPLVCATLHEVSASRRSCRICCCCLSPFQGPSGSAAQRAPPDPAASPGAVGHHDVSRLFPAGTLSASRDRSDADHLSPPRP